MSSQLKKSTTYNEQTLQVWRYLTWIYFVAIALFFLLMDEKNLPDYVAYAEIFANSGLTKEPFFGFINKYFNDIGLTYESFRNLVLLFCLSSLLLLVLVVQKLRFIPIDIKLRAASITLITYALSVFIFEFFVIRIRAGLAIALFCIGIAGILKAPKNFFAWILFLASVCIAFFVHKSSAVILIITFSVTAIPLLRREKSAPWISIMTNGVSLNLLYILATATLLFLVLTQNHVRSGVVISILNPIRFICLSVIPLMLIALTRVLRNQQNQYFFSPNRWVLSFENFYLVLSIGLVAIYFLGLTVESGEALVRFYTLLSFPALIAIAGAGSIFASPLCAYLLTINASFFLATLNMYPDYIIMILRWLGKS